MTIKLYIESNSSIHKIRSLNESEKLFVSCQDEFPLMFAIASLLPGTSTFKGIEDLANKESNRVKEMQKILKQIGIKSLASKNKTSFYSFIFSRIKIRKIPSKGLVTYKHTNKLYRR